MSVPTSRCEIEADVVGEQELDRVLDGDDVDRPAARRCSWISAASVVDLPLPVGPVISTRPIGRSQKSSSDVGQLEVVDRLDLVRDPAEGGGERAALHVDVAAEAGRGPGTP